MYFNFPNIMFIMKVVNFVAYQKYEYWVEEFKAIFLAPPARPCLHLGFPVYLCYKVTGYAKACIVL